MTVTVSDTAMTVPAKFGAISIGLARYPLLAVAIAVIDNHIATVNGPLSQTTNDIRKNPDAGTILEIRVLSLRAAVVRIFPNPLRLSGNEDVIRFASF